MDQHLDKKIQVKLQRKTFSTNSFSEGSFSNSKKAPGFQYEAPQLPQPTREHVVVSVDPNGVVDSWSPEARKMFGYSPQEILGQKFYSFLEHEAISKLNSTDKLARALRHQSFEEKIWLFRKDQTKLLCEVLVLPKLDSKDQLLGYSMINRDITQSSLHAETLLDAEEKFQSITQSASEAIISIDSKGHIASWNRGAAHIFGIKHEQAIGQKVLILMPPSLRPKYSIAFRNLSRRKHSTKFLDKTLDLIGRRADGTEFPMEISISRSEGRLHTFYSAIIHDVSERQWILKLQNTRLNVANAFLKNSKFSDVIDDVLAAICRGMGWQIGGLWVYKPERRKKTLVLKHCFLENSEVKEFYKNTCEKFAFSKGSGIPGRTWDSECLWLPLVDDDKRFEDAHFQKTLGVHSSISFAIGKGHEFYGVMEFFSQTIPQPDTRLFHFLSDMGSLLAQYVRRREAEQQLISLNFELEKHVEARTRDLAKVIDREKFFSDASTEMASSLDYKITIQKIAQLAVPKFADFCIVNMLDEAGNLPIIATSQSENMMGEILREIDRRYPLNIQHQFAMSSVVRLGRSMFAAEMSPDVFESVAKNEDHLKLLKSLNLRSYLCAPLRARGKIIGTITLALAVPSEKKYQQSDLVFIEDLADRAALAIDNANLYSEIQNTNKTKDEFLATLSHELRTPLNVIQGWVSILKSESLQPKDFSLAIEMLDRNTNLQARLINDLLDVSRIVTGKLRMEYKQVDIVSVLQTSVDSVAPLAAAKKIHLQTDFNIVGYYVRGDYANLQRVFVNILSNAIKFSGESQEVLVRLIIAESHLEVVIRDHGQGIAPEFRPFIFESFKQEDSSSTRLHQGLGLGLAIAQHIVLRHSGHIGVKSEGKKKGSEFSVCLPLYYTAQHTREFKMMKALEEETALIPMSPLAPLEKMLTGVRVLLVDDASDMLVLLTRFLERSQAVVVAVNSASEAFEYLKRNKPDILLSDIGMPGEDGYCLIEKIRQLRPEDGGRIPAIALTAYAREEEKKHALESGFSAHLSKPVQHRILVEMIFKVLQSQGH